MPSLIQKTTYFYKFYKNEFPQYVFKLFPIRSFEYPTRITKTFLSSKQDITFFKKNFILSAIMQWNNIDLNIRNSSSLNIFRKKILKFITPSGNSVFNSHNRKAIKLIARLRVTLNHLRGSTDSSRVFKIY